VGGSIAAMFIILYSSIGIYGVFALDRMSFYASAPVARSLGPTAFAFINLGTIVIIVMMTVVIVVIVTGSATTSASSTLILF
jgi:hypothetical protein